MGNTGYYLLIPVESVGLKVSLVLSFLPFTVKMSSEIICLFIGWYMFICETKVALPRDNYIVPRGLTTAKKNTLSVAGTAKSKQNNSRGR